MVDAAKKINIMNNLLYQLLALQNRYYVTNWCIILIEDTYEIVKRYYKRDIFIHNSYHSCINVLKEMVENLDKPYVKNSDFYEEYMRLLNIYIKNNYEIKSNKQ